MLISVDTGEEITKLPHQNMYDSLMKKLSASDYKAIESELEKIMQQSDVNTSSWIPGKDWYGTVYYPIYVASGYNQEVSGKFFGLILFKLMMDSPDKWGFGKYQKNGIDIKGITYFRLP